MDQEDMGLTPLSYFKNNLGSNPSRNPADLGTSGPPVAPHHVEGLSLFGNKKAVDSPISDLMDLPAKGMTDLLLKKVVDLRCGKEGFVVLLNILKPLPAHDAPDRHNGTRQRTA